MGEHFSSRRAALVDAVGAGRWCHVSRNTEDPELGSRWLATFEGAGLDGVIAKRVLTDSMFRASGRWSRSNTLVTRTAWRSVTRSTRAARGSAPSCSASTARMGNFRWSAAQRLSPLGPDRSAGGTRALGHRCCQRRRAEQMELRRRQDLDPDPSGEGRRGGLRPDGGESGSVTPFGSCGGVRTAIPPGCTFDQLDVPLGYDLNDVLAEG